MGSSMYTPRAYQMDVAPIMLKQLAIDCDIPQGRFADATGASRPSINLCLNRGYIPTPNRFPRFQADIERFLKSHPAAPVWLQDRGLEIADIWKPAGVALYRVHPPCTRDRMVEGHRKKGVIPGNPDETEEVKQMNKVKIPQDVLKHYKLFKDPFQDDPRSDKEVFKSDNHRYIEYSMFDAAENCAFLAVIAGSGAGKTVMRRVAIDRLRSDERVRIVYPQIIDKHKINAGTLCDAIVLDLAGEKVKLKRDLECKARHVQKLLVDRATDGKKVCLIIEEAHDLLKPALKYLKRFNELELGFQKLLGIILIGQNELLLTLNEEQNPDIKEVIRRVQIAQITGLDDNTWDYLELKFSLVGGGKEAINRVITPEAVDALVKRLTLPGENGKGVSVAYPLTVNNYVANAMVLALEMGEGLVTVDVINAL